MKTSITLITIIIIVITSSLIFAQQKEIKKENKRSWMTSPLVGRNDVLFKEQEQEEQQFLSDNLNDVDFSLISSSSSYYNDNLKTVPSGLCVKPNFWTFFQKTDVFKTTYFFSTSFCDPNTQLTPAGNTSEKCGKGVFRLATKVTPSSQNVTEKDDLDCGFVADGNGVFQGVWPLNATYSNKQSQQQSTQNMLTLKLGIYRDFVANKTVASKMTPNFLMYVNCLDTSTQTLPEENITKLMGGSTTNRQLYVYDIDNLNQFHANGFCHPYVNPASKTKKKSKVFFAIAVTIVVVCFLIFVSVFWRAKMAGDVLRNLKKSQGKSVHLGG